MLDWLEEICFLFSFLRDYIQYVVHRTDNDLKGNVRYSNHDQQFPAAVSDLKTRSLENPLRKILAEAE